MILVTGHCGLVGSALVPLLRSRGHRVRGLDIAAACYDAEHGDVRDDWRVHRALHGVTGVVHLAAVSRVARAERDPGLAQQVNVHGLRTVLGQAEVSRLRPWVLFVSSREVYGHTVGPVSEGAPFAPVNVYGRTKRDGELLVHAAQERGLSAAVVRLSNVYGSLPPVDHFDRVVPAFVGAALRGESLVVEGVDNAFDFVHVSDAASFLVRVVDELEQGRRIPPIHCVTGTSTSLGELARFVVEEVGAGEVVPGEPRTYDVSRFQGDPSRAAEVLGWRARVLLVAGLRDLVRLCRVSRETTGRNAKLP